MTGPGASQAGPGDDTGAAATASSWAHHAYDVADGGEPGDGPEVAADELADAASTLAALPLVLGGRPAPGEGATASDAADVPGSPAAGEPGPGPGPGPAGVRPPGLPRALEDALGHEAARRFRILLPADWMTIPLAPEGRRQRIRRLVRSRAGTADDLAAARYRAVTEMEKAAEAAARSGVFLAAAYERMFEGHPVSASLAVSVTATGLGELRPPSPGPGDDTDDWLGDVVDLMAGQLTADADADDDVEEVSSVRTGLGPAVRHLAITHTGLRGSKGRELLTSTIQYLVPQPATDVMLVMSFSTPTLPLARQFVGLFDAMAATARLA